MTSSATRRVIVASCVSGGVPSRLADALARAGLDTQVAAYTSSASWQQAMSGGVLDRLRIRMAIMIVYPLQVLARVLRDRPTAIIATTNPFVLPYLLSITRRLHRCAVVTLVYDLYPDALEAVGTRRLWYTGPIAHMTRSTFRRSSGVVFIGGAMAQHAIRRYGEPQQWKVIATGASAAEHVEPVVTPFAAEITEWSEGRVLASYIGNLGRMHDWETLANALRSLSRDGASKDLAVLLAASGPGGRALERAVSPLDARFVRTSSSLSDSDWAAVLQRSDASIVTLSPESRDVSVPSKTFSAMAAGCALLVVAPPSDVATLVRDVGCGAVVEPGDADGLAAALVGFASDRDRLTQAQCAARRAATETFDIDVLALDWDRFLGSLVDSRQEAVQAC
jgi:colanic acid biosynthesis glycosyl transferase WcaI